MSRATQAGDGNAAQLKRIGELESEMAKLRFDIASLLRTTGQVAHDFGNVLQTITGKVERFSEDESAAGQYPSEALLAAVAEGANLVQRLQVLGDTIPQAKPNAALRRSSASYPSLIRPTSSLSRTRSRSGNSRTLSWQTPGTYWAWRPTEPRPSRQYATAHLLSS